MDAFARRLRAAYGFLELGMPQDAWNELEEIEARQRHPAGGKNYGWPLG